MAYDARTAERVRRTLRGHRNVVEKRMVGGLSFNLDGSMCCGVTSAGLMVRVGPDGLEKTLTLPHVQPVKFGSRRLSGFVIVEPAGYRTDAALKAWVRRGIDFVSTPRAKSPRIRSGETRPSPSPRATGR
ncbi:MAG TPA: TfoX/Sxy family protein [Candidatus Dormibacteraeota bacterium]|nr:TfoX/Sxy family protein [Candidatus Dormibacteraeota bacterium]